MQRAWESLTPAEQYAVMREGLDEDIAKRATPSPRGITYSAAMNPSPARPYDNLRSMDEIHASAMRENAWFCAWLESRDPRSLVRMFRALAEWHTVSARGSMFEV